MAEVTWICRERSAVLVPQGLKVSIVFSVDRKTGFQAEAIREEAIHVKVKEDSVSRKRSLAQAPELEPAWSPSRPCHSWALSCWANYLGCLCLIFL